MRASAEAQDYAAILGDRAELIARLASPADACALFRTCDALRRRSRMETLLDYRECVLTPDERGAATHEALLKALEAWCSVDAGAIARSAPNPREIPVRVLAARETAVSEAWPD